jgi:hypothetical protein
VSLGQVHYSVGVDQTLLALALPTASSTMCVDSDDEDHDGDHHRHGDGGNHDGKDDHGDSAQSDNTATPSDGSAQATDCKDSDSMGLPDQNLPADIGCGEEQHRCEHMGDH